MPMWPLIKDHLRRNWKSLTLLSLVFAIFSSMTVFETSNTLSLAKTSPWIIYVYYSILASRIDLSNDLNFIRFSRTLPFRESSLANLVWSMAVVASPLFSFVIVLLFGFLAFYFGKAHSLPIAWPLLFLLLATLLSGVLAFVRAWIPQANGPLMARRNTQSGDVFSSSYIARVVFAVACAATVIVLLFYPTPTRWSDLTPRHLAGMGLAAWLTWKSYRLRYWLLQSELPRNAIRRSPKLECVLKSRETPPPHYGSVAAAVAQDLKLVVRGSLIMALLCVGCGYLVQFCLARSGLAPQGSNIYEFLTPMITASAIVIATVSITIQIHRLSLLRAVRALPLTGNQCVLLFLSYPYAATLAVVPCVAAYVWLTGHGSFPTVLLGGILLSAGLCPFEMFLRARFGERSIITIVNAFFLLGLVIVLAFPAHLMPLSAPLLCAGGLLSAVLGIGGYCGLLYLVENSSAVYKRKMSPQQFGQR